MRRLILSHWQLWQQFLPGSIGVCFATAITARGDWTDLAPILNAPGRLESAKRTVIRCQLENLAGSVSGGASTMLSVLPEGTFVKQGDVLARLDASSYEELQRQQVITVEQAKASHLQARLDLEIALLAVNEYRDGIVEETLKGMEAIVVPARSDLSRVAGLIRAGLKMSGSATLLWQRSFPRSLVYHRCNSR